MKVGDRISGVNGKWLVSASEIKKLRELQTQTRDGKVDNTELMKLRNELREKAKNNVTPSRARELLTQGRDGTLRVSWIHGGQVITKELSKTKLAVQPVTKTGNVVNLRFFAGAESGLKSVGATDKDVTLDLRQSTQGSFASMRACLEALAPADTFGSIITERKGQPAAFSTANGASTKHRYELIVDDSTRGAAEVFALAMSSRGYATLKGTKMAGDLALIDVKTLPDGSGYLLPIGVFRPNRVEALTGGKK
jgi:C-terminal processing protease CtpA/Prc